MFNHNKYVIKHTYSLRLEKSWLSLTNKQSGTPGIRLIYL